MLCKAWGVLSGEFIDLFNECLATGNFSVCWKVAEMCPILKTLDVDPREKSSYKPISLLPAIDK